MCYSPEADLMAGVVVGVIGVDAVRHVDRRSDLALAALPLVLALHQGIEAFAWWGMRGEVPAVVGDLAVTAYLLLALVLLPAMVPYAVMRTEPSSVVRRRMRVFVVLGVFVSIVALSGLIVNPYGAAIGGRYIAYSTSVLGGGVITGLYAVAVCTPFLLSSHRRLVTFGMINAPVVVLLSVLLSTGVISLWCVWAAVTSIVIALHIRETSTRNARAPSRSVVA